MNRSSLSFFLVFKFASGGFHLICWLPQWVLSQKPIYPFDLQGHRNYCWWRESHYPAAFSSSPTLALAGKGDQTE